jgi:hypothetical protein
MYCGGGHLGFPIGILNIIFVEGLPVIIPGQFGFNCSNAFFSETTNIIKTKLYMNVHWIVLYKLYVFCWISDRHIKHNICRGPSSDHSWAVWFQLSKWFHRRSDDHWKVLYKIMFFMSIGNPRWPSPQYID